MDYRRCDKGTKLGHVGDVERNSAIASFRRCGLCSQAVTRGLEGEKCSNEVAVPVSAIEMPYGLRANHRGQPGSYFGTDYGDPGVGLNQRSHFALGDIAAADHDAVAAADV